MVPVRLGTRGSALALAQSGLVASALTELGAQVETIPIRTSGDEANRASAPSDKSRFVKEIEEALLAGEIDLAVHSAKDVPGALPEGLAIVGVPQRADPRDALSGATNLDALPEGASVGTSSLRRRAQLLALRPDLHVVELRGNVDTRLRKLAERKYDAVVLAVAGLVRLGRTEEGNAIPASVICPAAGQGCLALETRAGDEAIAALAGRLTHPESLVSLTAERALVSELDATCRTPLAAYARVDGGALTLDAFVGLPDGGTWIRDSVTGDPEQPAAIGREMATRLRAVGVEELLTEAELAAS
jgi:hydroxymethylbilane synthase